MCILVVNMNLRTMLFEDYEIVKTISPQTGKKDWYIKGVFMQSNIVNRNGRLYPKNVLDAAVNEYIENWINRKRAVGELTHPETTKINPDRISHLTQEIIIDGNYYIGKAKILDTPCGKICKALLDGGVQLAVSSRADGSVYNRGDGVNVVNDGMILKAIDVVYDPSAPDAFVEGLMENAFDFSRSTDLETGVLMESWDISDPDVALAESIRNDIKRASKANLAEAKLNAWKQYLDYLKG